MASVFDYCKQQFFGQQPSTTHMSNAHWATELNALIDRRKNYYDIIDVSIDGNSMGIENKPDHRFDLTNKDVSVQTPT